MGLQDRDYMRRTQSPSDLDDDDLDDDADLDRSSGSNWRVAFFAAVCVIALASLAIWLLRGVQSPIPASTPIEGSLVVNINSATQAELETVPGIGPRLAPLIIEGAPYQSVDDLLRVSGIGKGNLERMRPFLKTDGETQPR
jgi:competence ComEA-like helix-hairpin-helix protein